MTFDLDKIIGTYGFPIALACVLLWFLYRIYGDVVARLRLLEEWRANFLMDQYQKGQEIIRKNSEAIAEHTAEVRTLRRTIAGMPCVDDPNDCIERGMDHG